MYPLSLFNFPGAGGNWQEIMTHWWSPNISVNFAGNAAIEREVSEDVASYGTQIGWLNDVVAALANAEPAAVGGKAKEALDKLLAAKTKIEEIKARRRASDLDLARDALRRLGASDASAYGRLVRSLDPDQPLGAARR